MAIPPTAFVQPQAMDPTDKRGYRWVAGSNILQDGATFDVANPETGVALGAEAVAAGLTILDSGDYSIEIGDDDLVLYLTVDEAMWGDPMFDGAGVSLPIEFTFWTTTTPPERKQKTLVVKVAHQ